MSLSYQNECKDMLSRKHVIQFHLFSWKAWIEPCKKVDFQNCQFAAYLQHWLANDARTNHNWPCIRNATLQNRNTFLSPTSAHKTGVCLPGSNSLIYVSQHTKKWIEKVSNKNCFIFEPCFIHDFMMNNGIWWKISIF